MIDLSLHQIQIPTSEITTRLERLKEVMIAQDIDTCIVTSSVNIYYFTGLVFDGFLYISTYQSQPIKFVKRPVGIVDEQVHYIRKVEQVSELLMALSIPLPQKAMLESDVLPFSLANRLLVALDVEKEYMNASQILRTMRMIKSTYELDLMRKTANRHAKIYKAIPHLYQYGMTDLELQIVIEEYMRKEGSMGVFPAFGGNMQVHMGIVLSGDNAGAASPYDFALGGKGISPVTPIGASNDAITEGMSILVDMAGNFSPYMSDITRSYAVGKLPRIAMEAHRISVDLNQWIVDEGTLGMKYADIYTHCLSVVEKAGLSDYFMGTKQQARFVGHGLGLEINELPVMTDRSRDVLTENTAFAFEPKFVIPSIGGVGVENTYIVTDNGMEKITDCEEELINIK